MILNLQWLRVFRGLTEYLGLKSLIDPVLQPNVTISSFDGSNLRPLDAHAAIKWRGSDEEKLVYLGGCQVNLELWHNGIGSDAIRLKELNIEINKFSNISIEELNKKPAGEKVFAEGTAKSYRFDAIVNGSRVDKIRWITGNSEKSFQTARYPPNIISVDEFDENRNDVLLLKNPSDPIFFKGTIRLGAPGMYHLRFSIESSVIGEKNNGVKSEVFLLYMHP